MRSPSDFEVFSIDALGTVGFIAPDDQLPHETAPNAINVIENMRVDNGSIVPMDSYTGIYISWWDTLGLDNLGKISNIDYVHNSQATFWVWFQDKEIGSVNQTITPQESWENPQSQEPISSATYTGTWPADIWITSKLNAILMATNGKDAPQVHYKLGGADTISTDQMIDFPNWPTGSTAKYVAAYKSFVVCGNVVDESGKHLPNAVWWSHPSDPGFFPGDGPEAALGWDVANPESSSGRSELGRNSGAIISMVPLRDSLMIYCENAVYRMSFVGGQYIFKFIELFGNTGIFGPNSVVEYDGMHFCVGKDDVYIHDGQQRKTISDGRIKRYLYDNLSIDDRNVLNVIARRDISEIWVMYRKTKTVSGQIANDHALIWNYEDNVWTETTLDLTGGGYTERISASTVTIKELPRLIEKSDTDAGIQYDLATFTYDSSEAANLNYGTTVQLIGQQDYIAVGTLIDSSNNHLNNQFEVETSSTGNTQIPPNIELAFLGINLSDDESNQIVTGIYPKFASNSDSLIDIWVSGRDSASSLDNWQGPFEFNPRKDFYIPCRVRGRRHSVKAILKTRMIESDVGDVWEIPTFKLRGLDVKFVQAGRRA